MTAWPSKVAVCEKNPYLRLLYHERQADIPEMSLLYVCLKMERHIWTSLSMKLHCMLLTIDFYRNTDIHIVLYVFVGPAPALFPQPSPLGSQELISSPKLTSHCYETLIGLISEVIRNTEKKSNK